MESRTTHHDRILAALRDKITGGDWPPGFQLPFETQLAEQHGVSRMTMNKVLGQLVRDGYVLRRKRLGTFVAQPMAQAAVMAITDIQAEVEALGLPWRFQLSRRELRPPRPEEIAAAAIREPTPVLALQGLHFAADQPFCLEQRIINPAAAPAALTEDFSTLAPGQWLLREVPWSSADHRIRAIEAPAPVARSLGLRTGTACLEITRRTEAAGQWVTLVVQTYPGTRHQLVSRFTPDDRQDLSIFRQDE